MTNLGLLPAAKVANLKTSNRRILQKFSPLENTLVCYPAAIDPVPSNGCFEQDQTITSVKLLDASFKSIQFQHLYQKSLAVFSTFQQVATADAVSAIPQFSLQYKSLLEDLVASTRSTPDFELATSVYSVWTFADAFIFNKLSDSQWSLGKLLEWAKNCLTDTEMMDSVIADIKSYPTPHQHPSYFKTVFYCLTRGLVKKTLNLLLLSPSKEPCVTVVQLLKDMPLLQDYSQQQLFRQHWMEWKRRVAFTVQECLPLTPEWSQILSILNGNEATISDHCDTILRPVTLALFTRPTVTLSEYCQFFVESDECTNQLIESIAKLDVFSIIKYASKLDLWLVSHLTDFLCHMDLLKESSTILQVIKELEIGDESCFDLRAIRDFYIENYAEFLYNQGHVMSCLQYYRFAGSRGLGAISWIISCTDLSDDFMAEKLLKFCREHGFISELLEIHCILAKMALDKRQFGTALLNYALGMNFDQLNRVIELCVTELWSGKISLEQFADLANLVSIDFSNYLSLINLTRMPTKEATDFIGKLNSIKSTSSLEFLERYAEFLGLGNSKEAAQLICLMFTSQIVPFKFWPFILFEQTNSLVESSLFEISECLELVRIVEELNVSVKYSKKWFSFTENRVVESSDIGKFEEKSLEFSFKLLTRLTE